MNDERWYDLTLPDGTPLLAYDADANLEGDVLKLELTLEAASAELVADSGVFGPLHVPDHPGLELRLVLLLRPTPPELVAALRDGAVDAIEVLAGPEGGSAHRLDAFWLDEAIATIPGG